MVGNASRIRFISGPSSLGDETATFSLVTYRALVKYRAGHNLPPSGYFGSLKRKPQGRVALSQRVPITLKALKPKETDFEPQTLGEHVRRRRLELGLTQRQAAERLGVSPWTVLNGVSLCLSDYRPNPAIGALGRVEVHQKMAYYFCQ